MHEPDASVHYPQTVLEFESGPVIDLRFPLATGNRARLQALFGSPFAVITADNPGGAVRSDDENVRDRERLNGDLSGYSTLAVIDRSPDASHQETGVAVPMSKAEALRIALRWGQDAIFWFDGAQFSICYVSGAEVLLDV